MKNLKDIIVLIIITGGLVFARTGKDVKKEENKNLMAKNQHYFIKDHAEEDDNQLERKRSNKRRRKIKKPVKGLR